MRCDCTAEPPGELIRIATAGAAFMAKARSSCLSTVVPEMLERSGMLDADPAGQSGTTGITCSALREEVQTH